VAGEIRSVAASAAGVCKVTFACAVETVICSPVAESVPLALTVKAAVPAPAAL
jgi:hypothetical protein